jgi:hypothetical protein
MKDSWPALLAALLTGGLTTKIAELLFGWVKTSRGEKKAAKALVDAHLDPLLKAADAIVGKTTSLAERDFSLLTPQGKLVSEDTLNSDLIGLAYLYARFWGRIEILAAESLGMSLATDKRGAKLQQFIACLGSQRVRLVNRTSQNAIGEITTELTASGARRTIGVVEFEKKVGGDASARAWCDPLLQLLSQAHIKAIRQRLLVYGVVAHALVDTLDPKHQSTHPRPSYPNKLSKGSKAEIQRLAFGEYLNKVGAVNNYT